MTTHPHSSRPGPAIRTRGLTRHFTRHKQTGEAVRGLDLEVADGELPVDTVTYGLLGAAVVAMVGVSVGLKAMRSSN